MLADNFIEWTDKLLHNKGRTVELRMLGARIVLTDHSENIKAVMSTKVVLPSEALLGAHG